VSAVCILTAFPTLHTGRSALPFPLRAGPSPLPRGSPMASPDGPPRRNREGGRKEARRPSARPWRRKGRLVASARASEGKGGHAGGAAGSAHPFPTIGPSPVGTKRGSPTTVQCPSLLCL
jgi:hypothetical protein